jgi:hypothetical protein
MNASQAILERWFARTAESYSPQALPFIKENADRFRNPVGHTLREGLGTLLEQVLGGMDTNSIAPALDAIIRIRAVQDLAASEAVGFVFGLKPILRDLAPEQDQAMLDGRIDRLALMAFDTYMRCREQVADIRVSESLRTVRARQGLG